MAFIGAIFTSTYHTKHLYPWLNSSASDVVNYSWLPAYQGGVEPFEGNPSTRGCLTSPRNKPQQKQPEKLLASLLAWIVSQCVRLSFDSEKCVLMLCVWKPASLKSSHNFYYSSITLAFCKQIIRQTNTHLHYLKGHWKYILCFIKIDSRLLNCYTTLIEYSYIVIKYHFNSYSIVLTMILRIT